MNEREAIECLKKNKPTSGYIMLCEAIDMAIKALEKQAELRENCEGECSDCKYIGKFHCANDLLIESGCYDE